MKKEYGMFVEELRLELLELLGLTEEKIFFRGKTAEVPSKEDRLFLEVEEHETGREVCGIYTKELYAYYEEGTSVKVLAQEVKKELEKAKKTDFFEKTKNLNSYEKARKDLFIRLLNKKKNEKELQTAVYQIVGDIALVLYMKLGDQDGYVTSVKIRQEHMEKWQINPDDVMKEALKNTAQMTPPRIYFWEKLLYDPEYDGEEFMDETKEILIKKEAIGNCLSTSGRVNGAVAIFLPGVASRLAALMEEDIYLVFTSVHEVMVHNACKVDVEDLREVLRDTIQAATPEEDYLTSEIYRYCSDTGKIIPV